MIAAAMAYERAARTVRPVKRLGYLPSAQLRSGGDAAIALDRNFRPSARSANWSMNVVPFVARADRASSAVSTASQVNVDVQRMGSVSSL